MLLAKALRTALEIVDRAELPLRLCITALVAKLKGQVAPRAQGRGMLLAKARTRHLEYARIETFQEPPSSSIFEWAALRRMPGNRLGRIDRSKMPEGRLKGGFVCRRWPATLLRSN